MMWGHEVKVLNVTRRRMLPPEQFLRTQRALVLSHKSSRETWVVQWKEKTEWERDEESEISLVGSDQCGDMRIGRYTQNALFPA